MKKLFAICLSMLMGIMMFTGCSKNEPAVEPEVSAVSTAVQEAVEIPQVTVTDNMDTILTMYDLDASKIAAISLLKSGNGANADEIVIIKLNDAADITAVTEALELRLTMIHDLFADYNAADMPKIENAEIISEGAYAMLAVCTDSEAAVSAFKASFEAK